jgi:Na+/proline symporter
LVFSSGDAAINNVASIVQIDILDNYLGVSLSRRQSLYVSFALQIGLGVIGVVGALGFQSILGLLVINSAINIALIFPLYLGLVWRGATSSGAFWSILLSLGIGGSMIAAQQGPLANLVALLVSVTVLVGLSYLSSYRRAGAREPGREEPERAGGWIPKVVVGTIVAAALYAALYALASVFGDAVWRMPEALMYPLYVYAIIGCVAMVLVLPIFALRGNK